MVLRLVRWAAVISATTVTVVVSWSATTDGYNGVLDRIGSAPYPVLRAGLAVMGLGLLTALGLIVVVARQRPTRSATAPSRARLWH